MLKLNKVLVSVMAAMAVSLFASCATDSDSSSPLVLSGAATKTYADISTIYGRTYKGSFAVMSATLKVTDANSIYLVGGPNGNTVIKVENREYTAEKSSGVYTINTKNAATGSDADFTFTLTVYTDGSVVLGYNGMSVNMSQYIAADEITGTYKGTATIKVLTSTGTFDNSAFVVTKLTDTTVSLKVPSMKYSDTMTFPEYTLTDGVVSASNGKCVLTFADITTAADTNGKTTTVSGISATIENNVLTFSATEKYGSMPFSGALNFTSTSKE